jgi:hypothetical protein
MSITIKTLASTSEKENRQAFFELYKKSPVTDSELLANVGLYQKRQDFSKQLFFHEIYQQILSVHGVIMEFGTRWGQNLVTLHNLRSILEPFNYSRRIVGFDTFAGFESINTKDGAHEIIKEGAFSVTTGYETYLEKLLAYHETEAPLPHIKKNFLVKGNAIDKLQEYLQQHPETIIAFAYFDFDIYEPTFRCLELIRPYLTKGTVIGFDELNDPQFPGETIAVREALGLGNISIKRNRYSGIQSYCIIE